MHFDELRTVLSSSDFALWLLQQQPQAATTIKSTDPLETKLHKQLRDITARCNEIGVYSTCFRVKLTYSRRIAFTTGQWCH